MTFSTPCCFCTFFLTIILSSIVSFSDDKQIVVLSTNKTYVPYCEQAAIYSTDCSHGRALHSSSHHSSHTPSYTHSSNDVVLLGGRMYTASSAYAVAYLPMGTVIRNDSGKKFILSTDQHLCEIVMVKNMTLYHEGNFMAICNFDGYGILDVILPIFLLSSVFSLGICLACSSSENRGVMI